MPEGTGFQLIGSYAAVPANGPAANESQPHPLPGLRVLGVAKGPQDQNPSPALAPGIALSPSYFRLSPCSSDCSAAPRGSYSA